MAVLQVFSREHPSVTLSEAASLTGLTRATARRILLTLQDLGYVRAEGRRFLPTPRVLGIGYAYLSSMDVWQVAHPFLVELADLSQESCSAATLDGTEVVYVARVASRRVMAVNLSVGARVPAYATSMGRVLLAGLEDGALEARLERMDVERFTSTTATSVDDLRERIDVAREAGWAMVDQELEQGVRSAAVPIRDSTGAVLAALNVSVHATRMTMPALRKEVVPRLLRTAAAIEVDLSVSGVAAGAGTP